MKKLFYTLGAVAATVTPVVAVVSCGSTKNTTTESTTTTTGTTAGTDNNHQAAVVDNTPASPLPTTREEMAEYLNKFLDLKDVAEWSMWHLPEGVGRYGFQAATRWGDQELEQYSMDAGWKAEADRLNKLYHFTAQKQPDKIYRNWADEYRTAYGFQRFGTTFQIFENVFVDFKKDFDYSNGGDIKFEFMIMNPNDGIPALFTDLKTASGEDHVHASFEELQKISGYDVNEATGHEAEAKEAILALANLGNAMPSEHDKAMLMTYFDQAHGNFFEKTLADANVQKWIHDNIDTLYNDFVKFPVTPAGKLPGMVTGLKQATAVSVMGWLLADNGEKRNMISGIKLLKFVIENEIKDGNIKLTNA